MTAHYIALEGIEGSGKSSLAPQVALALEEHGHPAVWVREPGGTEPGEAIRDLLLTPGRRLEAWTEALLFAAQRAQLAAEVIGPALRSGTSVVGDRSVYSSLAYQGAARGLGVEVVRAVNRAGLGDVWPNFVVLLQVDPGLGLERQMVTDRIGSEGVDFQAKVASAYATLAEEERDRFVLIPAGGSLAEMTAVIVREVLARW